ncbi:MAG: glucose-6-phosphate dehydrogenase, partial [Nitrosomonas sp.]|nr:glucose-6-phosphate dehydrogenase [Nitrosomonas sp.]
MNDAKMSQTEKLPCLFVIFGATGDLASNKLLPALFELENAGRLADNFSIVAFSRREWTTDDWLEHLR